MLWRIVHLDDLVPKLVDNYGLACNNGTNGLQQTTVYEKFE